MPATREAERPVSEAGEPLERVDARSDRFGERLQVRPRTKGLRPLARQNQNARLVICLEGVESALETNGRRGVDRVPALGAGDGEHRRRSDPLVPCLTH